MSFDPANSPLLTPIDIASTPSYGLPMTSNVIGGSTYNTSVVWGGPGGTFQVITTGNLAQIAQLTTPGFIAIKTAGSEVVTAHITAGTGIGVTAVGDDFQVSVTPNTTTQRVVGQYNSTTVGLARSIVNLKAGLNTSITLADSGTSLDWTINAAAAASITGPYVITQAASALTGATNLGALTSGVLYSTVSGGISTISTVSLGSYPTLGATQTWTGVNTYSQPIVTSGASILPGTIATTGVSGTAMNLSSVQTVTGIKTFSAAPVLSGASITAGTIPIASVVGTAVALAGAQTITGVKTFTPKTIFSASLQIPTGGGAGKVLGSDGSGNAAWTVAGAGNVTLAGANVFTGTNTYDVALPTSTVTPTTSTELVTKTYVDSNFALISDVPSLAGTNAFTGTNTFNTNLPTSSLTPSSGAQLITKTYADATYGTISGGATLAGANAWTGTNTFNTNLPTSSQTPSSGTQLITKTFADTTYGRLASANAWSSTNTFNTSLPTSTVTPSGGTDLITKTFADTTYGRLASANAWTSTNTFNTSLPTSSVTPSGSSDLITKTYADTTYNPIFLSGTVSTTNATPTTLATIAVPTNQATTINGQLVARNTSGSINDTTGGRFTCTAVNTAGTVTLAATPDVVTQSTSTGTFNVVVSGTNLIVQVTGIAATNYNWSTKYSVLTV